MNQTTGKRLLAWMSVVLLIACAMCIRLLTRNGTLPSQVGLLRNAIHFAMLITWGIYIQKRIIQTQVRKFLLAIVALMGLWLLLKMINYSIDRMNVNRHLWYLYYVPMLFIPAVSLFISASLGKAEDYRLPRRMRLLYVPTAILLLLVLTNDRHQFVFSFPSGRMTPQDYRHETGYFLVLVWIMLCGLAAFIIMLKKCRISRSKKLLLLPLVPLALSLAYTIAYIRGFHPVLLLAGDMTVTQCLLIFIVFEGCIQCGLIQSNIGYKEMLEATTLPIQITDKDFYTENSSAVMQELLPPEQLCQMTSDSLCIDQHILLKRHPIRRGWVFWEGDISQLQQLEEELELTRDELRDTGNILAAENAQHEKYLRLSEENRLYDMMEEETSGQIDLLRKHLADIRSAGDPVKAGRLLGQAIIIGTYIKRRDNLILVGAQRGTVSAQELQLCFNESVESLNLYGVTCKARIVSDRSFSIEQATKIYDLFEAVIETGLESLESLLISVECGDGIEVNLCVSCTELLDGLKKHFPALIWTQDEDGLQYITVQTSGHLGGQTNG